VRCSSLIITIQPSGHPAGPAALAAAGRDMRRQRKPEITSSGNAERTPSAGTAAYRLDGADLT